MPVIERVFEENLKKQRMEEELNIARDLQMSMLPATCPQVPAFSVAAASIPAREVGGDFFDFIEMREGKLGLVFGDVTGKSVSGALVIAASRSIFRMLSEEELAVDEIMKRANRRAKKDMIEAFERTFVDWALSECNGNISEAARRCDKERRSFGRLLKKYGIDRNRYAE